MRRLALVLMLGALPAAADVVTTSPRPLPRPAPQATLVPVPAVAGVLRPRPRPDLTPLPAPDFLAAAPGPALVAVPRPRPRPDALASYSPAPEMTPIPEEGGKTKKDKRSKKGSVCGNPAIKGEKLAPIRGKVKGCGLDKPVRVTSVAGVRLSQPATISCETAGALHDWIESAMRPAFGSREVVELQIAASYVCRPRNNKRGAKISEHGRGKAVDISGFVMGDGTVWTVARNYNKTIAKAHRKACGIFGTTLGPGSDGYHEDHLHFDVARYSGGPYCR